MNLLQGEKEEKGTENVTEGEKGRGKGEIEIEEGEVEVGTGNAVGVEKDQGAEVKIEVGL